MGFSDRMRDGRTRVIRMNAIVEGLAATIKYQQARIEDLTGRVIRLETAPEIALAARGITVPSKRIEKK